MPFRLLKKKKYKDKSKKERLIHGKYTKREDTAQILQEQLRKSASTPNISEAVLRECEIPDSFLQDPPNPVYLSENETTKQNAGILMLSHRTPSLDRLEEQQQQQQPFGSRNTVTYEPGRSPGLVRKTNGNNNLPEQQVLITALRNLQVNPHHSEPQSDQGIEPDVSKMGYRHPPSYEEISQKQTKKGNPILEHYRHPPPYRDQNFGTDMTSMYSGNLPVDHAELVYSLMRNYGGMHYLQHGNLPTSASMNFQDINESQNMKSTKDNVTDSYLYQEGSGYAAQVANYSRGPTTTSGLSSVPSRHSFTFGEQVDYRQPSQMHPSYIQPLSSQGENNVMGYQNFHMSHDQMQGPQAPDIEPPLPPGWEMAISPEDNIYYIDHNTQTTHWQHPIENEELPEGWERVESPQYGVYYVNHATGSSQRDHPAKAKYIQRCLAYRDDGCMLGNTSGVGLAGGNSHGSLSSHPDSLHVSASPYIDAEIPEWLATYAKAPSQYDQLLKWELFRYNELDCWQTILKKMYKKEVEQIVMRYEETRQGLQRELERQQKQQKRLSQQAYAEIEKESDV